MSDEIKQPSELDLLKKRADMMNISYHANIGLAKLKAKVNAALNPDAEVEPEVAVKAPKKASKPLPETPLQRAARKRKEARELVRVRVTCMNPKKREYDGEIFTVSNGSIGSIRRYVPFGNEDGWHIERAILNIMTEKKCQVFSNGKDGKGRPIRVGKNIKEFAIEILEPLTHAEIKDLAHQQALKNAQ